MGALRRTGAIVEARCLEIGGISVEIVRKDIKALRLTVYPSDGRVRVAAPLRANDESIRFSVVSRLGWIRKHQARFRAEEEQSARETVSGESHFVAGRPYRLDVVETVGAASVRTIDDTTLQLRIRPGESAVDRAAALERWYRRRLHAQMAELISKWAPIVGVGVAEWRIKKMRTRWGSCNCVARRLWFALELAKKPPACVEYVVVHELAHLLERRHDARFKALMDAFLPTWRLHRRELNRAPLAR